VIDLMSLLKQSVEKKAKPKPARRTARKRRAA
jgi:non-homologous end joining protein Ku